MLITAFHDAFRSPIEGPCSWVRLSQVLIHRWPQIRKANATISHICSFLLTTLFRVPCVCQKVIDVERVIPGANIQCPVFYPCSQVPYRGRVGRGTCHPDGILIAMISMVS